MSESIDPKVHSRRPINGASSSVDDEKTTVTRSARQVKKPARFHLIEPQVHSQNERKFVRHQLEKRDHMSEGACADCC